MKNCLIALAALCILASCRNSNEPKIVEVEAPELYVHDVNRPTELDESTAPKVYAMAATRTTNKMLDETSALYEKAEKPGIYVMEIEKQNEALPNGLYLARQQVLDIIKNSDTFIVKNSLENATYHLKTEVDMVLNVDTDIPVVIYRTTLYDKEELKIGEWVSTITKISNEDEAVWW